MRIQYLRGTSDRRPNGFAVSALICGAGQFFFLPLWARLIPAQLAGAVIALAFGVVGNRQAKASGQPGRGIAKAGIVLGAVGVGISGIMILIVIAIVESLAGL